MPSSTSWQVYNLNDAFPQEAVDSLVSLSSAVSQFSSIMTQFQQFLDLIKNLIVDYADPVKAAIQVILDEIRAVIDDFRRTSIYMIAIYPRGVGDTGGLSKFISTLETSFYDTLDEKRPIFSDSAQVGGVVLALAASDVSFLKTMWQTIYSWFELESIKKIIEGFERLKYAVLAEAVAGDYKTKDVKIQIPSDLLKLFPVKGTFKVGNEVVQCDNVDKPAKLMRQVVFSEPHSIGAVIQALNGSSRDVQDSQTPIELRSAVSGLNSFQNIYLTRVIAYDVNGNVVGLPNEGVVQIGSSVVRYTHMNNTEKFIYGICTEDQREGTPVYLLDTRKGQAEWPNWYRLPLADWMPAFGALYDLLEVGVASLEVGSGVQTGIENMIKVISQKTAQLQAIITQAQNAISQLQVALAGSVAAVAVESSTGIPGWLSELQDAQDSPDWNSNTYVGGMVLFGGTTGAYTMIKQLFGL